MPQGGYDSGSENNPNSVAESESDSSDECDLNTFSYYFWWVFLIKIQFRYQGNTQSQN